MTVENIVKIYRKATKEEVQAGITWYQDAQDTFTGLANKYKLSLHIVVGVAAALSPNNKWDINIRNTEDMIKAYLGGAFVDACKPSTYKAMRDKAWSILQRQHELSHEDVIKVLNGQKIVSFYRNIMGDDTCTVDGHALNIYRNERHNMTSDKTNVGKKAYREIQEAYTMAGAKVRVNRRKLKAYEMQAITWVVWRRLHDIA